MPKPSPQRTVVSFGLSETVVYTLNATERILVAPRDSNPDILIQIGPSLPLIEVATANSQETLRT
jgi:hypothetical protein